MIDPRGAKRCWKRLTRFTTTRSRNRNVAGRARIFAVLNAKGWCWRYDYGREHGYRASGSVAAKLCWWTLLRSDSAALHLNLRPNFGVVDALQNLHRMDGSLLEGLMTPFKNGLHLLAGSQQPFSRGTQLPLNWARLFDLLVSHYSYVVVDCGGRTDQPPLVWSATFPTPAL